MCLRFPLQSQPWEQNWGPGGYAPAWKLSLTLGLCQEKSSCSIGELAGGSTSHLGTAKFKYSRLRIIFSFFRPIILFFIVILHPDVPTSLRQV